MAIDRFPHDDFSHAKVSFLGPKELKQGLKLEVPLEVRLYLPDDPVRKAFDLLIDGISFLLKRIPPEITAFQAKFRKANGKRSNLGGVLASIIQDNFGPQLDQLFPQSDESSRVAFMGKWFEMSFRPHCLRELKAASARSGYSEAGMLAAGLLQGLTKSYQNAQKHNNIIE